jgi:hypothetical protein
LIAGRENARAEAVAAKSAYAKLVKIKHFW